VGGLCDKKAGRADSFMVERGAAVGFKFVPVGVVVDCDVIGEGESFEEDCGASRKV